MPKRVRLRALSPDEVQEIRRLANARKESIEVVRRARLIEYLIEHPEVPASRAGMQVGFGSNAAGPQWVKRVNECGVAGLLNRPKSGRPAIHTEEVHGKVISLALQKPESVGYSFKLWTVSRLQVAVEERHNLHIARSTIWEWLEAEGLDWKRQESWFHEPEKHDPQFVEKRGPSSGRM